jgi:hypothetical protein
MAQRMADKLAQDTGNVIRLDQTEGGVIIADAIFAGIEPLMAEDKQIVTSQRYQKVPPPFSSFWIEAKSSRLKGFWVGAACRAERNQVDETGAMSSIRDILTATTAKMGLSLVEDDNLQVGWTLVMHPLLARDMGGGRWHYFISPVTLDMLIDTQGGLLTETPSYTESPELVAHIIRYLRAPYKIGEVEIPDISALVLETLAMMNCANVKQQTIEQPPDVRKAYQKKHRLPMSTYKILTVKGQNVSETPHTHQGGSHAAPRLHRVRGHFKHFADGRQFWWDSFLRGRDQEGSIKKSYRVKGD